MVLDPYLAERVHLLSGLDWADLDAASARAAFEEFGRDPAPWVMPEVEVVDRVVPHHAHPVPVRVYRPVDSSPVATLAWVHGGGFAAGSLDMAESHVVAAELASRAQVEVVSIGYRLAVSGIRYPAPVDDVHLAWKWVVDRSGGRPCALGGASAGAALALAAALRLRDEGRQLPRELFLAYPLVHFPVPALDDRTAHAMRSLPAVLRFTPAQVQAIYANYVGRIGDLPSGAAPGHASLRHLPPSHVISCEMDDLRPSAELLVDQLREVGCDVETVMATGMPHGHLSRTPTLGEVDRSLAHWSAALRALR